MSTEAEESSLAGAAAAAAAARDLGLFRETPLIHSKPISQLTGKDVYLKLDALQSSGSFKDRGMAHLCHTLRTDRGTRKLISSSGGNAGLAVASVGGELGMSVSVVVPETTKELVIAKLRSLGADVTVHGENWNAADQLARERANADPAAAYISPYDNPLLWTGHSTVMDEIQDQMMRQYSQDHIGAVIVCVGGGGLLCGVLEGLERQRQRQRRKQAGSAGCTVIAAETTGAASFGKAWEKGEPVRLDGITSVATSLGALEVTPEAIERGQKYCSQGGSLKSVICTDAEAVQACLQLADDHRLLVEPACGAALAVVYSNRLRSQALDNIDGPIVTQVCGGSGVSLDLLAQWKEQILK